MTASDKALKLIREFAYSHPTAWATNRKELLNYIAQLESIVGIGTPAGENDICTYCTNQINAKSTSIGVGGLTPKLYHVLCYINYLETK